MAQRRSNWARVALVSALCCLISANVLAAYRITFDEGGIVDSYIEKYTTLRLAGASVVIDGPCLSACALIAGLLPAQNVCVTERAVLGFHSIDELNRHTGEHRYHREATRLYWRMLPPLVRGRIISNGWDGESEHPELVFLEGDEFEGVFERCAE